MENNKIGVGIGIMLFRNNQILLGKRNEDPEKASSALHGEGTWTMPGGKMCFGETFEEGAKREVKEETGIILKSVKLISLANDVGSDAHFVTIGLLSDDFEGEAKILEPDEIIEWKWFSLDKLPSPIFKPSQKVLDNYFSKKIY